mgnify:CR=1 FL=1|tara:strand:- start:236 stop:892 length:657 start_codon:yes stop_codon:yes gene_type:complete
MKYIAEGLGTFFLVAVVVGSGIMAENLSGGNNAIALLGNTIATGAILFVIIKMFAPISGAHFNPIVSFIFFLRKELTYKCLLFYMLIQVISGLFAVLVVHYIFQIDIFQISTHPMRVPNAPWSLFVSEIIATFGLIATILFIRKNDENSIAIGVALFITAGYWFTSSTSFANPAVTIARIFTDTFTGISPDSVPYFLLGQLIGGLLIHYLFNILDEKK